MIEIHVKQDAKPIDVANIVRDAIPDFHGRPFRFPSATMNDLFITAVSGTKYSKKNDTYTPGYNMTIDFWEGDAQSVCSVHKIYGMSMRVSVNMGTEELEKSMAWTLKMAFAEKAMAVELVKYPLESLETYERLKS